MRITFRGLASVAEKEAKSLTLALPQAKPLGVANLQFLSLQTKRFLRHTKPKS